MEYYLTHIRTNLAFGGKQCGSGREPESDTCVQLYQQTHSARKDVLLRLVPSTNLTLTCHAFRYIHKHICSIHNVSRPCGRTTNKKRNVYLQILLLYQHKSRRKEPQDEIPHNIWRSLWYFLCIVFSSLTLSKTAM